MTSVRGGSTKEFALAPAWPVWPFLPGRFPLSPILSQTRLLGAGVNTEFLPCLASNGVVQVIVHAVYSCPL